MGWWMLLWPVALLAVGVVFYYVLMGPRTKLVREDEALEIARRRFARGEITAEEFEEVKKRLR